MEPPPKPTASTSLFQVYLRLRPPPSPLVQLTQQSLYPLLPPPERYLVVEPSDDATQGSKPTHITIRPPSDSRKRAVEKFTFSKVFEEESGQLEIFKETGVIPLVEGVLGEGRDGLLATLGVTGSGKSHTILGSKSQRGLTQLSLDLLYRSLDRRILHPSNPLSLIAALNATDPSEALISSASVFLESVYGEHNQERMSSRATTPMTVGIVPSTLKFPPSMGLYSQWSILSLGSPKPEACANVQASPTTDVEHAHGTSVAHSPRVVPGATPRLMRNQAKVGFKNSLQESNYPPNMQKRHLQRPSTLPQCPDISNLSVAVDQNAEYAIQVSMYEVYNDRIFDLLSHPQNPKDLRRRPLLFKPTEASPDRKVVAGLRKIVCGTYEEALMVLETGLMERRVAGTGSNSASSRSHGFFCVEVKKRPGGGVSNAWNGAQLTIVDLAGSERARNAKTAGATLAEAGKINESLMYLGQCLQMQSDCQDGTKTIVPFRQCKLTELLFSNSFPSTAHHPTLHSTHHHRNAQKAIMIVTADPLGDFNATSQILRYSALAREVTVPRIPSVTSTIMSGTASAVPKPHGNAGGSTSPNSVYPDEAVLEMAFSEVARLNEQVEILNVKLHEEQGRRREAEEEWQKAEDRAEEVERDIREECWQEMERRLEEEKRRWMTALGEEVSYSLISHLTHPVDWLRGCKADRKDEHLDRKLDVLAKGIQGGSSFNVRSQILTISLTTVHEDGVDPKEQVSELQNENQALRSQLDMLQRELHSQSPTRSAKKAQSRAPVLGVVSDNSVYSVSTLYDTLNGLGHQEKKEAKTPGKKIRKFTARKWDLMDENEMDAYENT
ncbi:MAG: hypothetical protein Q9195_008683 [Heterodermia aff. obscurata]